MISLDQTKWLKTGFPISNPQTATTCEVNNLISTTNATSKTNESDSNDTYPLAMNM